MSKKVALITGITGQEGAYLAELLLKRGCVVRGLKRRSSLFNIVRVDPRYFRPAEVDTLLGDAAKARQRLGWKPRITFRKLVAEMAREDLKAAERDALVGRHGHRAYGGRE